MDLGYKWMLIEYPEVGTPNVDSQSLQPGTLKVTPGKPPKHIQGTLNMTPEYLQSSPKSKSQVIPEYPQIDQRAPKK